MCTTICRFGLFYVHNLPDYKLCIYSNKPLINHFFGFCVEIAVVLGFRVEIAVVLAYCVEIAVDLAVVWDIALKYPLFLLLQPNRVCMNGHIWFALSAV
jgi:hypothetical protein